MFGRIREALRERDDEHMPAALRAERVEHRAAIAESYQRLAEIEESRLGWVRIYRHGRFWSLVRTRLRLTLYRRGERAARADVERLRGR